MPLPIHEVVAAYFDDASLPADRAPEAVIIVGTPAAGKTTYRKQAFSLGHVLIDAADIFLRLSAGEVLSFPDALERPLQLAGRLVASRAIAERRNIVTEIIGDDSRSTALMINALRRAGYSIRVKIIRAPLEVCIERNENRGDDDISAFFAQEFNVAWIVEACREALGVRPAGDLGQPRGRRL
ncbi:MAG: ATP-binding protein [Acidobacteria bacterium]|nr:ATP-binding protein [Acidobacteriota bacterium]